MHRVSRNELILRSRTRRPEWLMNGSSGSLDRPLNSGVIRHPFRRRIMPDCATSAPEFYPLAIHTLTPTDRALWRRAGLRLGIDEPAIAQYLPPEKPTAEEEDPLTAAQLRQVAIVCLREQQARAAAAIIRERTSAEVSVVASTAAGPETAQARQADVVLFVWMASTHAVFRAFDGFDRKRFCYVQGTGGSSIVRSLERWARQQQP